MIKKIGIWFTIYMYMIRSSRARARRGARIAKRDEQGLECKCEEVQVGTGKERKERNGKLQGECEEERVWGECKEEMVRK